MDRLFDCNIKGNHILISDEHSKLGYGYPRVFIEVNPDEYINLDLTLGCAFKMTKEDFNSWLDGSEIKADAKEVCEELHINYDGLCEVISNL